MFIVLEFPLSSVCKQSELKISFFIICNTTVSDRFPERNNSLPSLLARVNNFSWYLSVFEVYRKNDLPCPAMRSERWKISFPEMQKHDLAYGTVTFQTDSFKIFNVNLARVAQSYQSFILQSLKLCQPQVKLMLPKKEVKGKKQRKKKKKN